MTSTRRGKIDSTSAAVAEGVNAITVAEIEAVVQKAVTAAVSAATDVLREEFGKLFDEIQRRLSSLEDRMEMLESRPELPAGNSPPVAEETMRELELIRKETRECRTVANDNEQYSRRHNLRIRGLSVGEGIDCRQAVADFCRSKLHLEHIDAAAIDVAHVLPSRPKPAISGVNTPATTSRTEPTVIVKFYRQEVRDAVISKRKALKGTRFSILEDLTNLNVMTLNRVRNDARVQSCWSWNGKIYAVLSSGAKILVKPYQPIDECHRI